MTITMQRLLKWATVLILSFAVYYFFISIKDHFESIPPIQWGIEAWLAMVASVLLMLLIVFFGSLMWMLLLKDQGVIIDPATSFRIVGMAGIGKYLPGNVGHLVGQVTLASTAGVPVGVSVMALLISSLWLVATGLSMGGAGLLLYFESTAKLNIPIPGAPVLTAMGIAVAVSPWVAVWCLNRFVPSLSRRLGSGQLIRLPSFHAAIGVAGGFILCFFIFGVALKIHAVYLFGVSEGSILSLTLMFTSAWIAGYLLPGAPGGLGVREALMVALLGSVLGMGAAIGVSVTMRLATVLGDGMAFLVGLGLKWAATPPTNNASR
jgi:glycosyltransferase 2 family protein